MYGIEFDIIIKWEDDVWKINFVCICDFDI